MSSSKGLDTHLLHMECLSFFNPFVDGDGVMNMERIIIAIR